MYQGTPQIQGGISNAGKLPPPKRQMSYHKHYLKPRSIGILWGESLSCQRLLKGTVHIFKWKQVHALKNKLTKTAMRTRHLPWLARLGGQHHPCTERVLLDSWSGRASQGLCRRQLTDVSFSHQYFFFSFPLLCALSKNQLQVIKNTHKNTYSTDLRFLSHFFSSSSLVTCQESLESIVLKFK